VRRILSIIGVVLLFGGVFAHGLFQSPVSQFASADSVSRRSETRASKPAEKKIIDFKSDLSGPVAPGDSAIFLVGNFAAQHNGAVITCDSAVRYSDMRMEFFGNVLVNKNTTYIYGDRADYDGELNEVKIYSDIIKVVDGDATFYTYQFVFNTKTNIGIFDRGGVLVNRENQLESQRGYYYGDQKQLVCVNRVQMRNDEYKLCGDSVVYDMATDNAYFFERTNIWNRDGDYLYADCGEYRKADSLYVVTRNGYVLTPKQEMWSDSIDYYRVQDHIILRHDIQIDDTEHKTLAFGNYGEYWKTPGNALLTLQPSLISYDRSQGDSLFMRADSIFLHTCSLNDPDPVSNPLAKPAAPLRPAGGGEQPLENGVNPADANLKPISAPQIEGTEAPASRPKKRRREDLPTPPSRISENTETPEIPTGTPVGDSSANPTDTISKPLSGTPQAVAPVDSAAIRRAFVADSLATIIKATNLPDSVRKAAAAALKAHKKAEVERVKAAQKAKSEAVRKEKLAKISAQRKAKNTARLDAQKAKDEKRYKAALLKAEAKLRARRLRAERKGIPFSLVDSAVIRRLDSLKLRYHTEQDSTILPIFDSLLQRLYAPQDTTQKAGLPVDSIYRLVRGYRNVRIYRSDFQSVCDSMTMISTDSTIHLYIEPVLWNQSNQISSEVMDVFTKNQQIERAEFIGAPMMVSQLDTTHYNQVAGKTMIAYFRNNEIVRNDVNGNAQTIYYMQDGEPPVITMMGVIESGDISFYIENKQVVQITYRGNPVYYFYPIDKIPEKQELYLKGFKWEGERRPSQVDVFDRTIRPSERLQRSRLKQPDFPIQQLLDRKKQELIEQRRWIDRNDVVDPATVEWMRDLGYEVGQPRTSGPEF